MAGRHWAVRYAVQLPWTLKIVPIRLFSRMNAAISEPMCPDSRTCMDVTRYGCALSWTIDHPSFVATLSPFLTADERGTLA